MRVDTITHRPLCCLNPPNQWRSINDITGTDTTVTPRHDRRRQRFDYHRRWKGPMCSPSITLGARALTRAPPAIPGDSRPPPLTRPPVSSPRTRSMARFIQPVTCWLMPPPPARRRPSQMWWWRCMSRPTKRPRARRNRRNLKTARKRGARKPYLHINEHWNVNMTDYCIAMGWFPSVVPWQVDVAHLEMCIKPLNTHRQWKSNMNWILVEYFRPLWRKEHKNKSTFTDNKGISLFTAYQLFLVPILDLLTRTRNKKALWSSTCPQWKTRPQLHTASAYQITIFIVTETLTKKPLQIQGRTFQNSLISIQNCIKSS